MNEYAKLIQQEPYNFLRTDKNISNLMLLTLGGSHAYGTNVETSDIDIRGISYNTKEKLLGLDTFEQFVDPVTDTTIYSLSKIIPLLMNNNPNTIEMFGCKDEHYIVLSKDGKLLRDNIDLFLSQVAAHSFSGYATQQLRRLENAIMRDSLTDELKEEHIRKTLENTLIHFKQTYTDFDYGAINFSIEKVLKDTNGVFVELLKDGVKGYDTTDLLDDMKNIKSQVLDYYDETKQGYVQHELCLNINLQNYPLRDFIGIYSEMNSIVRNYDKIRHRNNKKDDLHLNKHSMHLVRLLLMGTEVLSGMGIRTFRQNDLDLLMSIRNGKYLKSDGTYHSDFFELVNDLEKRFEYAKLHTCLPEKPDKNKIQELVMEINIAALQ